MNSKGQGLSLNYIVIAIIAALILVIIVAFTTTGLGQSLSKIFQTGEQSTENADIDVAKATCKKLCDDADRIDEPDRWDSESYCERTFIFDNTALHCWNEPVGVECSTSGNDIYNTMWFCDESNCAVGCPDIKCTQCSNSTSDKIECPDINSYALCSANNGNWMQF